MEKINEKPILFSSEMVRAILDGRKTQTRRIVKENQVECPYGEPGNLLWVRETFYKLPMSDEICYKADEEIEYKATPSIFMPRKASRINLEITNIRVERLQDITEEDAINEGVEILPGYNNKFYKNYNSDSQHWFETAKQSFQSLWQSINGPESWGKNPIVWVVEFKVLEAK